MSASSASGEEIKNPYQERRGGGGGEGDKKTAEMMKQCELQGCEQS